MSDLFISHSSSDTGIAREVERRLAEHGHHSIFLDLAPERGIVAGQSWERTLYTKLRACRAVIALCTDSYLASHWCFAEIALARMEGKHIFVLIVDPFDTERDMPSILTEQQYIDLRTDPEEGFQRLWRGFKEKGIEGSDFRDWNMNDPPYPGLLAFEEKDAAIFFARKRDTDEGIELLNRVRRLGHPRLVMVLGASGSGKSSLVRAGLVPQLRRDSSQWIVVGPFRPGQEPAQELAAALGSAFQGVGDAVPWTAVLERLREDGLTALISDLRLRSGRSQAGILVVIDQFEELLGHESPEHAANGFLRLLREALARDETTLLVLAAMRSDYLDVFQQNAHVAGVEFKSIPLGPLSEKGMREIIEEPAKLGAIELENGLTEELLRDTGTADALPLLAFTLRVMWDRYHDQRRLEIREYEALGRLQGAVAKEADAVLEGALRLGQEDDLRSAFLKMARINEDGTSFARQPLRWDEVPPRAHQMLRHFVNHRLLLSRGDGTVEVSHETLFRSWARLSGWLNEDREFLLWRKRMSGAIAEWVRTSGDDGSLLHGRTLAEAERWLGERGSELAPREYEFIEQSRQFRIRQENAAREAQELERAREAALAAAEAQRVEEQAKARKKLKKNRVVLLTIVPIAILAAVVYIMVFAFDHNPVVGVSFVADGSALVVARENRNIVLWDVSSRKIIGEPMKGSARESGAWEAAAFSPDGRLLAVSSKFGHGGVLWDLRKRTEARWSPGHTDVIRSLAFSPDGTLIALAGENRTVSLLSVTSLEPVGQPLNPEQGRVLSVAFSPDGKVLATGGTGSTVILWNVATRKQLGPGLKGHEDGVSSLAFSPDGKTLASGSSDKTVRLWDIARGAPLGEPMKVTSEVTNVVFSRDGAVLLSTERYGRTVVLWRLTDQKAVGDPLVGKSDIVAAAFSPDDRLLAAGDSDGNVVLWDVASRKRLGGPIK